MTPVADQTGCLPARWGDAVRQLALRQLRIFICNETIETQRHQSTLEAMNELVQLRIEQNRME